MRSPTEVLIAWSLIVCIATTLPAQESNGTVRQTREDSQGETRRGQVETIVTFAAMGDVPYSVEETELLDRQIAELPEAAEFVIHLGDIKPGGLPCLASHYEAVANQLKNSKPPVFIIPGDNELNDCPRPDAGERHWRNHLMRLDENWEHDFAVARQAEREENFAFIHQGVLFVGLNLVGGRIVDREAWEARLIDDAEWLEAQFDLHGRVAEAMVLFTHAGPGDAQKTFFDRLQDVARRYGRPVLILHGDGHRWRQDQPLRVSNVMRVQVDQGGIAPH